MRVLNFGSINIDHVYRIPHILTGGETLASESYRVCLGGKGFNQSVALARAGASVLHAGCIGADGGACRAYLEAQRVDTTYLHTIEAPTGHTVIQVDENGQNCILLYGGANLGITTEQINQTLSAFERGNYLLLQNEISNLDYLVETAARRGLHIVLNPSPISDSLLQLPFQKIDWLLLNEVEGAALSGCPDADGMLDRLHERFPSCSVVLTLGEKGSRCCTGNRRFSCPAFPVRTVDTTAAGDTFTGYFLQGILAGMDAEAAMRLGAAAASIAVTRPGAADSIPPREDVEAMLNSR